MSIDEDLDRLLERTFAQARPMGHEDVRGIRAGAVAKAHRIRRKRRITVGAVSALVTAALVVGVGSLGGGWFDRSSTSDAVLPAGQRDWSDFANSAAGQAYSFPNEVNSAATPPGMSSAPDDQIVGVEPRDSASPLRLAGSCVQTQTAGEAQQWVAQTRSNYVPPNDLVGSKRAAELGLVGFRTGTGTDAFREFVSGRGQCMARSDLELTTWDGVGDDGALFLPKPWATGTAQFALASVRVGDVMIFGASLAPTAAEARQEATAIASRAATRLVQIGYPPALGKALGTSTQVPQAAPSSSSPEKDSGLVKFLPDESSLPAGLIYQGEPLDTPAAAPVMGVQACDPGLVDKASGMDDAPEAEAQVSQMAYSGKGLGGDGALTITVSQWAPGTGAEMFADLKSNTMMCRFSGSYHRLSWAGRDPESTWLSKHGSPTGLVQYVAAQRVGDVITAVVIDEQGTEKASTTAAIRLSDESAAKLKASNLPSVKGR